MSRPITIEKSVEMAIRRPVQTHTLLAKTLAKVINGENWIDRTMKKRFCTLFVSNYIDHTIEREVDATLVERIRKIPLTHGMRLLKRAPEDGLKVLVAVVSKELQNHQKLTNGEQVAFYEEILSYLFPEVRIAELSKA